MSTTGKRNVDLGGAPAGEVTRDEHDLAYWERRVDALVYLLGKKGITKDAAELRHGIEALTPEDYDRLSYYERWAASAQRICIVKGLLTQEEIEAKIKELQGKGA